MEKPVCGIAYKVTNLQKNTFPPLKYKQLQYIGITKASLEYTSDSNRSQDFYHFFLLSVSFVLQMLCGKMSLFFNFSAQALNY